MCDGIDRRIANRKLPRPVERDGGLTKADLSDAVHRAVGRRRRSLGPATVPEQTKHRKRNAKASCHSGVLFSCKRATGRYYTHSTAGRGIVHLSPRCSWSIERGNPIAAAFGQPPRLQAGATSDLHLTARALIASPNQRTSLSLISR